jgi:membrane-bound lytic murein transglycosylase F
VREVLPLLSQERYYTRTKRGYARGWEPVRYVENVQAYMNILEVAGTNDRTPGTDGKPASKAKPDAKKPPKKKAAAKRT